MNTSVEFEGEELVIRIPKDFVYANIVYDSANSIVAPEEAESFPDCDVLEDFEEFSVDLLNELRSEDETGWSLVNSMIRAAAIEAVENGAQGIKFSDE